MPKNRPNKPLDAARHFYGAAFDVKSKRDLAHALADWGELEEHERSFTLAHLLYLNLEQQAAGHRAVAQVRGLVDEVAESLHAALEASMEVDSDEVPDGDLVGDEVQDVAVPLVAEPEVADGGGA